MCKLPHCCCLQVWYTAVTSENGNSGVIGSVVRSDAGAAQGKLVIEAIHIVGVPNATIAEPLEAAKMPSVRFNGKAVDSGYDPAAGVIKISGISQPVGAPLRLNWRI